jgi:hypothetical protein
MNEEYILKISLEDGEFLVSVNGVETKVKTLGQAFDVGKKKAKGLSDATEDLGKKNQELISNAGLAGATLTELGRTISDLPYGIRGVANNLSQLSTLFITLVAKSSDGGRSIDGVRNAFGLLVNQLKGPLGFILAFQAVIALLDFFSGKSKKAKKDTEDFTTEIQKQNEALRDQIRINQQNLENVTKITNLYTYEFTRALKDSRLFAKQNAGALAEISERLEEVGVKGASQLKNQDISIENRIFAAGKLSEILEKQLEIDKERVQQNIALEKGQTDRAREIGIRLANLQNEKTLLQEQFNRLVEINEIVIEIGDNKKKNKKTTEEELELEEAFLMNLKGIQDRARGIQFQQLKTLEAEEISSLSRRGLNREEFEKEKQKIIDKFVQEEIDLIKFILKVDTLTTEERLKLRSRLADLTTEAIEKEGEAVDTLFDKIMKVAIEVEKSLNHVVNAISASIDAEISQEERKTTLLNNQLKKRLRNENLSKEERIAINKQIENNEVALQEKRDQLAEKAFKAQKAAAIASALIGTAESAVDAFGTIKGMKFLGPAALPLAIAAAATATAFGLKQVDAIRRTKFVPSAAPSSSGFGGSGGRSGFGPTDPAFNIVGTGQQFQLAQVIAQRTGEPIRAFVVSGDVRTGLALDRNIINSSKIN